MTLMIEHGLGYVRCYNTNPQIRRPVGYERSYALGNEPPLYRLPALIGVVHIEASCVCIDQVDEWSAYDPLLTWYNESWCLAMPADHGKATYPTSN